MKTKLNEFLKRTNIVGVVASEADSEIAWGNPSGLDAIEWRVDCCQNEAIEARMNTLMPAVPLIITVRDHHEGGRQSSWDVKKRASLYRQYLPIATFIDIEVSTAPHLTEVIAEAQEQGVGIILSLHDFHRLPERRVLDDAAVTHLNLGGTIFKIAVRPRTFTELCLLFDHVRHLEGYTHSMRVAPMAMGEFGKISRLMAGVSGSPLLYGCMDKAVVSGQWNALELRAKLAELVA